VKTVTLSMERVASPQHAGAVCLFRCAYVGVRLFGRSRLLALALAAVLWLPAGAVDAAPLVGPGDLLQAPGREQVWRIGDRGERRWVVDLRAFGRLRLDWGQLQLVPVEAIEAIPLGPPHYSYPPVRHPGSGRVYVFDGVQRRWIPDLATFAALGMRPEHVATALPGFDVLATPEGRPISLGDILAARPAWQLLGAGLTRDLSQPSEGPGSLDQTLEEPESVAYAFRFAGLPPGTEVRTHWTWAGGEETDEASRWNGDSGTWAYHVRPGPLPVGPTTVTLWVSDQAVRTEQFEVRYSRDPDLDRAYLALVSTATGQELAATAGARSVRRSLGRLPRNVEGRYRSDTHDLRLSADLRDERPEAVAVVLAHELWHAVHSGEYPDTSDGCVRNEVDAFAAGARVWSELGPPDPRSALEASHERLRRAWTAGRLREVVERSRGYQRQCDLRLAAPAGSP